MMRWHHLPCLVLGLILASAAAVAEPVSVRFGEHPGFSRIVFDWGGPVGARLEQGDDGAVLHFDRLGELDLARFRADPPPQVRDIVAWPDGTGLAVTVTTVTGATTRMLESGGKVVLDVLQADTPADAKASTPEEWRQRQAAARAASGKAEPAQAPMPKLAATTKAKTETPKAGTPEAGTPGTRVPAVLSPPVSAPIPLLPGTAVIPGSEESGTKPAPVGQGTAAAAPAAADKEARPKTESEAEKMPADTAKANVTPKRRPATAETMPSTTTSEAAQPITVGQSASIPEVPKQHMPGDGSRLAERGSPPVLIDPSPAPGRTLARARPRSFRLEWAQGTGGAAFLRGGKLWLVFDSAPPGDLAGVIAKAVPELEPVEQIELSGATLIRFPAPDMLVPHLQRDGAAWMVDLQPGPIVDDGLQPLIEGNSGEPWIKYPVLGAGRPVSLTDPDLGDRLIVVPMQSGGASHGATREFPQFRVLASQQGLVFQPFSETLQVSVTPEAVEVRDRDGLIISRGSSLALLQSNISAPRKGARLFDLEAWRRGDDDRFRDNKYALQKALADAEADTASAARLDLGQFYFAHGYAAEALSVLRLGGRKSPRDVSDPRARLVVAASEFLTDNLAGAAETLADPSLAGEWEADLWRAAQSAANHNWQLAAEGFAATGELIPAYPHAVRTRLRLLAAEVGLALGDSETAGRYLEAVRQDDPTHTENAQVAFLMGRRMYLDGDSENAIELWQKVVASNHRPSQIRARLALLDAALENGTTSPDEAVAELERLRFAWRGDRFEFALLQRLGDLYVLRKDYGKGLRLMRRAASLTPNSEAARAVARRMRDIFISLYMGQVGVDLSPLQALALYEEFKELTPPGGQGYEVILSLAERLVDIDLLDRAAGILEVQIEYRLEGQAKGRVAARLAEIRLSNMEPDKALKALDVGNAPDLPEELAGRLRLLRARALMALGREDEAMAALGPDDGPEALRLRARVLWRQENWPAAVLALERLVPEAPPAERPLRESESQDVVDLAIALTMAEDRDKITVLGRAYKEAMSRGPHKETFALLAGDLESGRAKSMAEELAQVDTVEAFIASLRKRRGPEPRTETP